MNHRGWVLVSRLAIFGRINVLCKKTPKIQNRKNPQQALIPQLKKKPKPKTTHQKTKKQKHICFEIFWIEFHLHLVKLVVVEINCFTFNVQ